MSYPYDSWSRRKFVRVFSRAALLTAAPAFAQGAAALERDTVTISVLHTTDLHGHILPTSDYDGTPDLGGLARCVNQIRRWRRGNHNTILIDVGDVYQGTDVGLRTKGRLMIDLFNHLKYDAWVIGNHEFDWGIDPFLNAVQASSMPVLAANMSIGGRRPAENVDSKNPLAKIQPYLLKEIAGIKVAIIGITTPGMPFWFRPEFIRDFDFLYPIEPVRRAMVKAKSEGANAILIAGHMGLKTRNGGDDFANAIMSLTSEFPQTAVFIAGHTHQVIPSRMINNVLVTQADHFGIHVGRVDLVFDRNSKQLLGRTAQTSRMDYRFRPDHIVLSRAKSQLAESNAILARPVGELAETLGVRGSSGQPSDIEMLIGAAIMEALSERSATVDGVFHGLFDDEHDFVAGPKTIDDIWQILPFENYVVTARLSHSELLMIMEETYATRENRSLLGFQVTTTGKGRDRRIASLLHQDGRRRAREEKYTVAFNTFDSRSAGHRFMKLRALLESPEVQCTLHDLQTRDALIEYFQRHRVVRRITAGNRWPAAA